MSPTPPCAGTTISWTSSNTNIATVSPSGNPVTVTKVGNGNTTLTAKISSGCTGGTITVANTIQVGSSHQSFSVSGNTSSCSNQTQYYTTNAPVGNINWSWPSDWTYQSGQNSTILVIKTGYTSGSVTVSVPDACSGSSSSSIYVDINCTGFAVKATPNPTTDNVTISLTEPKSAVVSQGTKALMYQIKVTDPSGNLKKQYKYASGISNTNISLQGLNKGVYTLQVFDGTKWNSVKVIKQ